MSLKKRVKNICKNIVNSFKEGFQLYAESYEMSLMLNSIYLSKKIPAYKNNNKTK